MCLKPVVYYITATYDSESILTQIVTFLKITHYFE